MINIFEIPTVNDTIPDDIDQVWVDRINAAFPFPYVTKDELDTANAAIERERLEHARLRNLNLGRELRQKYIKEVPFLDEGGVAKLLGSPEKVHELRESGHLIAVLDHGKWLYPRFQFNPKTAHPYPVVARIEKFFQKEINRWAEISWWVSPNLHLKDRAPYEFLTPERELELMLFLDENRLRLSD